MMAKPSFLLLLFFAFWATITAIAVLAARGSLPIWAHEQFWEHANGHLVSIVLPPLLLMFIFLLARLSLWERGVPSGPSDLDRLLQVKRAGLWRLRYRMPDHAGPSPAVPTGPPVATRNEPSQGCALDRLVALKRRRGWYPEASPAEDD